MKFGGRLRARAVISYITGVFPIRDHFEILRARQRLEFRKQFVLAEIAAVVRVREIIWIFELLRLHHVNRKMKLLRDGERFLELAPRQAGGIRNRRQRFVAQHLSCDPRKKNRIDPS